MSQLPYQNTQVIGDYGQAPSVASDVAGALGAYSDWRSDQTGGTGTAAGTAAGDTASTNTGYTGYNTASGQAEDEYGNVITEEAGTEVGTEAGAGYEGAVDEYGNPVGAHGGYLSSSGILAPYHKKLIDGLYAGGRINY